MDKYQIIDSIVVQVDELVDMRGVEKCRTVLDIIGKLNALRVGLAEDDKRTEDLKRQIREATATDDGDTECIDGQTYKIGAVAETERIVKVHGDH